MQFLCKPKKQDVYIGDVISTEGLEASVEATIHHRMGKVKGAMFAQKAVIEDFRLQAVDGMAGAIDIWEHAICQTLLANCGSWVGIGKEALKTLKELQHSYLRMVYSCPPSTPIPALRALAGILDMEHKVAMEKVCLVTTILFVREEQENYAREMLKEELMQGWKGLGAEVKEICKLYGLPDATEKYIYREEIKKAVLYHNLKIVKEELAGLEKTRALSSKDLREMQPFMLEKSLANGRLEFLWLTNMLDSRSTMKGKYNKDDIYCPHCPEGKQMNILETPQHWMICVIYQDLRLGIDPELILTDRPGFLRKVIEKRKELEADLRKRK